MAHDGLAVTQRLPKAVMLMLALALALLAGEAFAQPQTGQLIRDPNNPRYLTRVGSNAPVALVGPGSPEGFLYLGTPSIRGSVADEHRGNERVNERNMTTSKSSHLRMKEKKERRVANDKHVSQRPPAIALSQLRMECLSQTCESIIVCRPKDCPL